MSFCKWLVLLAIYCFLFGCSKGVDETPPVNKSFVNIFDLDITKDEYASIKQFSDRSDDRKNAAFKSFSDRYEMATYLMNHDLKENNEIRLKLAEFFQREVINDHLNNFLAEKISDEMVLEHYEKNKEQFIYNEYTVTVIGLRGTPSLSNDELKLEQTAKNISEQIVSGLDLNTIKDVYISDQVIRESNTNSKIVEQLRRIDVGGVTEPIKTRVGVKLYRLDGVNELEHSFEEIKSKIRYTMEQEARSAEFDRLLKLSVR